MTIENLNDEDSKLLKNLEGAMNSARKLRLRNLEYILGMAVLELADNPPTSYVQPVS